MLKVIRHNDRTVPIFCCDVCGAWIDDASLGAAAFATLSKEGDVQEVLLAHKGACLDRAEASIDAKGLQMGWHELSRYLSDGLHNSGVTLQKLQKMHDDDKQFGRL